MKILALETSAKSVSTAVVENGAPLAYAYQCTGLTHSRTLMPMVDAMLKNAELTLQSRVQGFTKQTLWQLLYRDRLLVDYPDNNLSILPTEDWPYFERYRRSAREGIYFSLFSGAAAPG